MSNINNLYAIAPSPACNQGEISLPISMKEEYEKRKEEHDEVVAIVSRYPIIQTKNKHHLELKVRDVANSNIGEMNINDMIAINGELDLDIISIVFKI